MGKFSVVLGGLTLVGGLLVPHGLARAPAAPCLSALRTYRLVAARPAAVRRSLDSYYEVGLHRAVFGPGPGLPVPWGRVAAWAGAHPPLGLAGCHAGGGGTLALLRLRCGYAYVLTAPDGRIAKLYLVRHLLSWD